MRVIVLMAALLMASAPKAQTKDLLLTADFKQAKSINQAVYAGTLEKKGDRWYRQLYNIAYQSVISHAWFRDEEMKIGEGEFLTFHGNGLLESKVMYKDGKKEGPFVRYYYDGQLQDSFNYVHDFYSGVQYRYYPDGAVADSMNFDGHGNGSQISWYMNGMLSAAGLWKMDTVKTGKWKYYDNDANLLAVEEYQDGKKLNWICYDKTGNTVDTSTCPCTLASFPGGKEGWKKFLVKNLNASVPVDNGAPEGKFTVTVQFYIEPDGKLTNMKAITHHGYGMEEEVLRLMTASFKWNPEIKFGRPVKVMMRQPVTFIVSEQ